MKKSVKMKKSVLVCLRIFCKFKQSCNTKKLLRTFDIQNTEVSTVHSHTLEIITWITSSNVKSWVHYIMYP